MDIFEIREITKFADADDMVCGTVAFHHQEPLGDGDVGQVIEVEVRISARDDITLEQLHQALFEKAVSQLHLALSLSEGRTAKELLAKTAREAAERDAALNAWEDDPPSTPS